MWIVRRSFTAGFPMVLWASLIASGARGDEGVEYVRDIQPLLRSHCYECHDGGKRTADLRLDVRANALQGGESGDPAIVPGASNKSALITRITAADDSIRMPPESPRLSDEDVQLLRRWIDAGADWPNGLAGDEKTPSEHWAFRPPQREPLPDVQRPEWLRNAVDSFVLARLESQGMAPSPEADRVTLLRRLFLDLTGLPPTIEDVDAFLLDNRPDAYPQLVERLLRSPHYGERWGRVWLDAARYADSDGYEKDKLRQVWFYRDWVVQG